MINTKKIKIIDQKYDVNYIRGLLERSDKAVIKAVVVLSKKQDADELKAGTALRINGKGFNRYDSPYLTEMAIRIKRGQALTNEEMIITRQKVKKYAKQLTQIANNKVEFVQLRWNV